LRKRQRSWKGSKKTMKALTLALLLSMPAIPAAPPKPLRQPSTPMTKRASTGRWYLAAGGHAVYCYGPVMTVPRANGELERVVTFCRDGSAMVPLFEPVGPQPSEEKSKVAPSKPRLRM